MTIQNVATGHGQRRRVAIYARVSTTEQHVEPQLHALRTYAEARGLEIAGEYLDHGVSGAPSASQNHEFSRQSSRLWCCQYQPRRD